MEHSDAVDLEVTEGEAVDVVDRDDRQFDRVVDVDGDLNDDGGDADIDDDDDVMLLAEVDTALELPMWQATGEARVDAALDLLGTLDGDDVHQHAAVFTEIHAQLRGTLVDLDATS